MKKFWNALFLSVATSFSLFAVNPNPPTWPSTVFAYPAGTPNATIQANVNTVFATNGGQSPADNGQFVNQGYAFLFAPGTYSGLNINIGYYTQILGLGTTPSATTISNVNAPQGNNDPLIGGLNSFWRGAENFTTNPTGSWSNTDQIGMTWAVSQAAALRKLVVNGTLYLFQLSAPNFASGFTSGGFMADCTVTQTIPTTAGAIVPGSQQQFFTRNCVMSGIGGKPSWTNGVWNQVFIGCTGAPASHCSNCLGQQVPPCNCLNCYTSVGCDTTCTGDPYTNVPATPIIAEKPYITADAALASYKLQIPQAQMNKIGTSTQAPPTVNEVDFTQVYVAKSATDTAATINAQLGMGYHVVLTPGIYNLTDEIVVNNSGTVILGIGLPILISTTGKPCITVLADAVRVGGVILQAGSSTNPVTPTLLQWGATTGSNFNSGFLYDIYTRSGRFSTANSAFNQCDLYVQINSPNIVCDNLWLWRADHDAFGLVYNGDNYCNTAFEGNGDNITAYGLFCEHTLQDLCQWNGNNGRCYGFQSEFPYDVTDPQWQAAGYVGYRVGKNVTSHLGIGIGVYSFFRDASMTPAMAISSPTTTGIQFTNCLTRFLNGMGGIASVLNGSFGVNTNTGSPAVSIQFPGPAYLCDFTGTQQAVIHSRGRR